MLIKKEAIGKWEYRATCESEIIAQEFLEFLRDRTPVRYYYREGENVFYLLDNIGGVRLAKPFIDELASRMVSNFVEVEDRKPKKSKDIEIKVVEGVV